jgi:hypothetical protein
LLSQKVRAKLLHRNDATANSLLLLKTVGSLAGQSAKPFAPWLQWYSKGYSAAVRKINDSGYIDGTGALYGYLDLIIKGDVTDCADMATGLSGVTKPTSMFNANRKLKQATNGIKNPF